jgi:hypothetical protein
MQLAETGEIDIVIAAKRDRFHHLYAEGVIEMEDLRARLSELDAMYAEAQRHRDYFETRRKHLKELENVIRRNSLPPTKSSPANA